MEVLIFCCISFFCTCTYNDLIHRLVAVMTHLTSNKMLGAFISFCIVHLYPHSSWLRQCNMDNLAMSGNLACISIGKWMTGSQLCSWMPGKEMVIGHPGTLGYFEKEEISSASNTYLCLTSISQVTTALVTVMLAEKAVDKLSLIPVIIWVIPVLYKPQMNSVWIIFPLNAQNISRQDLDFALFCCVILLSEGFPCYEFTDIIQGCFTGTGATFTRQILG